MQRASWPLTEFRDTPKALANFSPWLEHSDNHGY